MASSAEVEDQALWSSDSESSEDELEDELRVNIEFNFGEIHLDPENEEPEDDTQNKKVVSIRHCLRNSRHEFPKTSKSSRV